MSVELVMLSNHFILCHPLLLLPSIFPNIRVFSNESALRNRATFQLFPRTTVNLLLQLSKLASNVSCVTIQHSCEASSFHGWIIFAVTSHIATMDIFDRHILDIEAHTVPRKGFPQCFMVHFYRLHFSCYIDWRKGDHHARFENTSLHTTHRDSTNTTNFIDILERQTQGFVSWVSWWQGAVQSFKQSGSTGIVALTGDFPSLEPWHVSTWLQHVVTIPPEIGTNATVSGL
ncbi:hypothetical protein FD755_019795 [Muntiacus reevesi]|uniref:Uncharacterized protein n=1 Tax=Muntiacus reevesi TaxID=9886 RepID=A0A5N3X3L8_MUNRE|nr:hypothetical protein FD755_019795 [Muntiacus reevesi]